MNAHDHLLESLADPTIEPSPSPTAERRPPRRPLRTTGKVLLAALLAGILVAAVAGYQDAIDFLRGDRSSGASPSAVHHPSATTAPLPTAPPPDQRYATELAKVLADHRAGGDFVGARIAVADADGSITEVADGTSSMGTSTPVALDVAWNIGSATKAFVAVVALQLADEGRLGLDDGIDRWFPGLADAQHITPRMLLQHTSGLNEYLDRPEVQAAEQRHWTPDELVAVAESAGRLGAPGAAHHYSNTNYIVLGELIGRVTGHSWDAEVRSRVSDPLGMERTGPVTDGTAAPVGYRPAGGQPIDATHAADPSVGGAAGGLQSTGRDLLRFVEALEDGTLLSPASREAMQTFVPAEDLSRYGIEHGYGLGIERYRNDRITVIGHMGTGEAQSSFIGFDLEHHRAIAVQTNTAIPGPSALMALESLLAIDALDG